MTDYNNFFEFMDKQPPHCADNEGWQDCPVVQFLICPTRNNCEDCEFLKDGKK